jgi:hypothetical protein
MSDPYRAAPKSTQRLALAAMIVVYVAYALIVGSGGPLVFPIGVFLALGAGYVAWDWWSDRGSTPAP